MDDLPEDGEREPLVRARFLPLIHHHRYSTMRGYQYPLTDTDVGQLAASDRERFHLGCRGHRGTGNAKRPRGDVE